MPGNNGNEAVPHQVPDGRKPEQITIFTTLHETRRAHGLRDFASSSRPFQRVAFSFRGQRFASAISVQLSRPAPPGSATQRPVLRALCPSVLRLSAPAIRVPRLLRRRRRRAAPDPRTEKLAPKALGGSLGKTFQLCGFRIHLKFRFYFSQRAGAQSVKVACESSDVSGSRSGSNSEIRELGSRRPRRPAISHYALSPPGCNSVE